MRASIVSAIALVPLALGATVPRSTKVDYNGFKGLRITLPEGNADVADKIDELAATVLNPGSKDKLDVVVSPENLDAISQLANTTILVEDIGAAFAEEEVSTVYAVPSESWFTAYHSYADHLAFLKDLQSSFPGQSEIFTAGSSFQGRALTGIHIWGSGGKGSKPAVVLHGTIHAREWISTMTTEYLAYQLLAKYSSDSAIKSVVDKYDFYITPVANPDGFVYTQTTNRLWRKNRQTNTGSSCIGRDPNRNWPYKWELTGGASTSPCSETYKGASAGDAPEIKGLKAQIDSLSASQGGITLYLDIHSYGQYILWPFGYDCNYVAPDDAALRALAQRGATGIRGVSGTSYTIGNACRALYATTGDSTDYIHGVAKSKYTYTLELRDRGTYGFSLPASQIQPTVRETWAGVLAMLQAA
ncbi:zinc carboxypeptidase [Colletotrichum graminicola]|uniref:Zinc carboxypeptidase n=1 Tax=Colletotrichum graminicola (strain M1.001 / M2 / FGSC 10212) TaxID=645133 RepID=E3QJN7_COLGM|nr:zinc carboxypeptidase [Colletotrichum graminicola M1.001]EFQ31075.1 zinc carboxypeptidase [Colletotrichum graminicola M1.001]WDK17191.1 zinc carboxypeptidase [Colletotrichum graminicola]